MKVSDHHITAAARPVAGVVGGLLLASLIVQASGYHALAAGKELWSGATGLLPGAASASSDVSLGTIHISGYLLAQSIARVTPLVFTGLSVAIGLRAGLFNIGAQGQMTVGALAAAVAGIAAPDLNPALHVSLALIAGTITGALWGALAGILKAWRGIHEVISTIMLNYIAANVCLYLVTHSLKAPGGMAPESRQIAQSAWLTPFVPGADLTAGVFIAVAAALCVAALLRYTAIGFDIRAVGQGLEAARANGVEVEWVTVLSLSIAGALAGLAGAVQVLGAIHRYVDGISGSYGFDGIAVALLGGLTGGGVMLAALFFGALASGAAYMQLQTDVPDSIAVVVQAMVILIVGIRPRVSKRTPVAPLVQATHAG